MNWPSISNAVRWIIVAVIVCNTLVACITPTPVPEAEYELQIIPPPSATGYPFSETLHSYPIVLQFNFIFKPPAKQEVPADPFIPLYRLVYHVQANPDEWLTEQPTPTPFVLPHATPSGTKVVPQVTAYVPKATAEGTGLLEATRVTPSVLESPPLITKEPPTVLCPSTLFGDSLDLFGNKGPGRIEVTSSVVIPPGVTKLRVCAWLSFLDGDGEVQTRFDRVEFSVNEPPNGSGRYLRYRDGYLRGHLISAGRGLSWTWLKEYEPGVDPKDLLYNSRAIVVSKMGEDDYVSNLYVPWVKRTGTGIVYGGDENPLLRGGLAMATLGLEYLTTSNDESLRAALDLFRYVEASEWGASSENPTGFFLRSSKLSSSEVSASAFYPSADEIAGMTLGLYYLHEALEKANWTTESEKVVALVKRLGDHMRKNHFFIVPPADPLLPQERQKGWAGMYPLQWFLNGGFKAITGESFKPSEDITLGSAAWDRISALPKGENIKDDEELGLTKHLIDLELSSKERAILSIQGIGIMMRYGGDRFPLSVAVGSPLDPSGTIIHPKIPIPPPPEPPLNELDPWNFPMLLHVFQLGLADSETRDPDTVSAVKKEMRNLIAGVLGTEPVETAVFLERLESLWLDFPSVIAEGLANYLLINPLLPGFSVTIDDIQIVEVGLPGSDDDYYAAAIADKYDLFDDNPEYAQVLSLAIDRAQYKLADSLPIGKPEKDVINKDLSLCPEVTMDPNPDNKIGGAFSWEFFPERRIQEGGPGLGVTKTMIENLWIRCKDVLKEGAGLDYLLPTMIIVEHYADQTDLVDQQVADGINVPEIFASRHPLPACTNFPFRLDPEPPCEPPWPERIQDKYENNDWIENARQLPCGNVTDLNIDRSTVYSRGDSSTPLVQGTGRERQAPFSGVFYGRVFSGRDSDNIAKIWSTDDIDYFFVNCDSNSSLRVEAIVEAGEYSYHKLVVDGIKATSMTVVNGHHHIEIEVTPKPVHYIMFTGDAAAYELHINPVP